MSNTKSNHPVDKSRKPPDRSKAPDRNKDWNNQYNQELNRNEERTSPAGQWDQKSREYLNKQNKDQHIRSQATQPNELIERERTQLSRGMNAPGMKNDQGMNQPNERKAISKKRDRKSDQIDGEE